MCWNSPLFLTQMSFKLRKVGTQVYSPRAECTNSFCLIPEVHKSAGSIKRLALLNQAAVETDFKIIAFWDFTLLSLGEYSSTFRIMLLSYSG